MIYFRIYIFIIFFQIISCKLYCTKDASLAVEPSISDLFKIFIPAAEDVEKLNKVALEVKKVIVDPILENDDNDKKERSDTSILISAILNASPIKNICRTNIN